MWARRRAIIPCPRYRIVVVSIVGAMSLQVTWHLDSVGHPFVLVLWCLGGRVVRCSWQCGGCGIVS